MDEINVFLDGLRRFWVQFATYLPQVFAAVVLTIIGWLVAKLVRKAAMKFFKLIRLDDLAEKSGLDDFLIQGGVQYTTSTLLAKIIYWFIIFIVLLAIVNSLGLSAAADLFNKFVLYVPNVVVAVFVLMFGTLFSKFVRTVTLAYLNNLGISGAELMSAIAQWAILVFVVSMALEQLSIGGQILVSAFQISFGALCLALALAFGLGGRDWAAHLLEKLWKKSP